MDTQHSFNERSERSVQGGEQHLHELLKTFSTVMLGTFEQVGDQPTLVARPMHVAKLHGDCALSFLSSIDTEKVEEATRSQVAYVLGQSKTRFFSMRGRITVSQDRARIRAMWTKLNEIWFQGPDDPRVAIIDFRPGEAELWDASGVNGLRFLFEAAKALVTHEPPDSSEGKSHARVALR